MREPTPRAGLVSPKPGSAQGSKAGGKPPVLPFSQELFSAASTRGVSPTSSREKSALFPAGWLLPAASLHMPAQSPSASASQAKPHARAELLCRHAAHPHMPALSRTRARGGRRPGRRNWGERHLPGHPGHLETRQPPPPSSPTLQEEATLPASPPCSQCQPEPGSTWRQLHLHGFAGWVAAPHSILHPVLSTAHVQTNNTS